MRKTTSINLLAALCLAGASAASAQTPSGNSAFINVNGGVQAQSRTVSGSSQFPLFGETATVTTSQSIHSAPIFDISGGYKWLRGFGVSFGVSTFSKKSDATLVASILDPFFFDRPAPKNATASGLSHTEVGTHLSVMWFIPVTNRIDVAVFGGPSFIRVKHDVGTGSVAAGTQNLVATSTSQTGSAKGGNVGVSGMMLLSGHFGVDAFLRYAGGSLDLPGVTGLKVGGVQVGGGIHARF